MFTFLIEVKKEVGAGVNCSAIRFLLLTYSLFMLHVTCAKGRFTKLRICSMCTLRTKMLESEIQTEPFEQKLVMFIGLQIFWSK